jgi:hypothetical protein
MSGGGSRRSSTTRADRRPKITSTSKGKKGGSSTGGEPGEDRCDLKFDVDLEGINHPALPKIKVGDELDVVIVPSGTGYEAVVCRIRDTSEVVGALAAFPDLSTLIACIKQGNRYVATVKKIQRGACTVSVRRA